ncbi:MRN complex-interacting protein-like isoform X2 [Diaphorina citri]|uniref:MRN complex-interacting protein-like isoform X1 n=1 Tax=Diaphorina citri TaxID=121845 RepID=A0A1S3D0R4_DIACI|nr:MRN complex-interacting protein-like isoform X1 [Diaphorina citri]XP_026679183.1 MRN complex-interacting protein-like isoform X1 [Diaphorina citri]XP_026679184.1 MRN complex-interacting protein-like isoform X1 [Diaphorina citri]XP_026679185.1 MRN complex-interacting protein-like isoform X2 [Diaphorina citri]
MVQELQVLKCCSCSTFQVHIVKKAKKWDCKICNQKQSVKEVFGRGSGKDCRVHAQKLNALRAARDGSSLTDEQFSEFQSAAASIPHHSDHTDHSIPTQQACANVSNKWDKYLDQEIEDNESPEEDNRHLLEGVKCQKRKRRKLCAEAQETEAFVGKKPFGKFYNKPKSLKTDLSDITDVSHGNYNEEYAGYSANSSSTVPNTHTKWNQNSINSSHIEDFGISKPSIQNHESNTSIPSFSKTKGNNFETNLGCLNNTNRVSVSKWNKYLNTEDDDDNADDYYGTEEVLVRDNLIEESICDTNGMNKIFRGRTTYDTCLSEISRNIPQHITGQVSSSDRKSDTYLSEISSNVPQQTTSEVSTNAKSNDKLDLLQSLLKLKSDSDIENSQDKFRDVTNSMESNENQQSNTSNVVKKSERNIFEDPDDFLLDESLDF